MLRKKMKRLQGLYWARETCRPGSILRLCHMALTLSIYVTTIPISNRRREKIQRFEMSFQIQTVFRNTPCIWEFCLAVLLFSAAYWSRDERW